MVYITQYSYASSSASVSATAATVAVPFAAMIIPLLMKYVTYYQGDQFTPDLRPIDVPIDQFRESYDFIIVGGGSAGKFVDKVQ